MTPSIQPREAMNLRFIILTAATLLPVAPAFAQQPANVPSTLTLADAVRIAHENNPDYRKVLNDMDVASANIRRSWGSFLPSVNTSLNFSGASRTTKIGESDYGQPVERPEALTTRNSSASQGISSSLTLFDGGKMFRDLETVHAEERATEANILLVESNVITAVSRSFYESAHQQTLLEVERTNLGAARDRLDRTEQLFRVAGVSHVDLLGARGDVINAERSVSNAESETEKAKIALRQTLGIGSSIPFEVSRDLPAVFDPSTLDAERLLSDALQSSPSVRQSEASLAAAKQRARASKGTRWPTISASLGYNRNASEIGYGAFHDFNPNGSTGFSFGISGSLPVFSRFQTSATIAQAEASAEDAGEDLRRTRLQVERDVRSALVDLDKAYRNLQFAQKSAAISKERLELAEEQFRVGALTFLNLQSVIDQNTNAERQAVEARFTFINARVSLEEKLGTRLER
jgi:outer membrane protein TolC